MVQAAARLLRPSGRLCLCQRPERLCSVMEACRQGNLEPKRLRLVQQRVEKAPKLFLLEARKGCLLYTSYILGPQELYELTGDVPNVTFPCAALADSETGRIAIYYGCADTVTGLAFTTVDELLNYMKEHPLEIK